MTGIVIEVKYTDNDGENLYGIKVRTNLNIRERDKATWHKVKYRHLEADINVLKKVIEND